MYKLGSLVHAPMNCTTFLCLTFLIIKTFLCKLFLYVWIYTLRLEDFNCHFLTMYVPLYRSPYELNATLFSNFNCLTSISRMPIPSLGIVTKSYLHLIHISSCSPIGDKKWWFGQDCFSILKLSFPVQFLAAMFPYMAIHHNKDILGVAIHYGKGICFLDVEPNLRKWAS